jgi:phage shock protein PspC (stress-responsive transcriptional regulator)
MNATRRPFNISGAHGRFRRRHDQSVIMGVCAGLGDFFAVDRNIVRLVALLLLWLFTVPTMLLYLLLAWLGDTR